MDDAAAKLDLLKIAELFAHHGVEHLVIGGQAAFLHGSPQLKDRAALLQLEGIKQLRESSS